MVDVQCIMQGIQDVAQCYHTKIITTDAARQDRRAPRISSSTSTTPSRPAKKIVTHRHRQLPQPRQERAHPRSEDRPHRRLQPRDHQLPAGRLFRASYRPLNDNIINGRIRGVAGVVGCNNARVTHDDVHVRLVKELIKNDVLVLQTGCTRHGLRPRPG